MTNFITQIKQYQEAFINNIHSQIIREVVEDLSGIEVSTEQLVYITCVMNVMNNHDKKERPTREVQIPVQYLFSLLTPFPSSNYTKNVFQEYMADITKRCIIPLSSLIKCSGYTKDHCRRFTIDTKFLDAMSSYIEDVLEGNKLPIEIPMRNVTLGIKPAKWGGYYLKISQLPPLTKAVWYKLKESQFRFDIELFNSPEGKVFNKSLSMNKHQRYSLIHALSNMLMKEEAQYHDSFFIQSSGRLHTRGGPMNLNSTFRRKYIKPVNSSNYILEVDLKCAQLLALCNILGADDVRNEVISIIKNESIWNYVGNPSLPKELKKVIVYGFCFGAEYTDLPYLATHKSNTKYNIDQSITKKDVDECFSGVLYPLIELRDKWMSQYTIPNIISGKIDKVIHTNALGLKFNLNNELSIYKKEVKSKKHMNPMKIAARLLAFYAQAIEQLITQSLLAQDYITNNIITYSYDGFSLETSHPESLLNNLQSYLYKTYPNWHLDYQVYK